MMSRPRRATNRCFAVAGVAALTLAVGALALSRSLEAQTPLRALTFTAAQAEQGLTAYAEHCASCHGQNLDDGTYAPPLKGADFREKWSLRSPEALFALTGATMPPDRPGTLGDERYARLLAYIFRENGARPGTTELPASPEGLRALATPEWPRGGGGGLAPGAVVPPPPARVNPLDRIRPVTESMLTRVADGEWLTWRRTYDAFGFSPLKKINRSNVSELRVAWTWSLPNGPNESTPIVHDGVLFVHGYGDRVQALDAATGDLLWHHARR